MKYNLKRQHILTIKQIPQKNKNFRNSKAKGIYEVDWSNKLWKLILEKNHSGQSKNRLKVEKMERYQ